MIDRIHNDTTAALKAGDKKTAEALRLLYSSLKNAEIENLGPLTNEQAIQIIKKEMKKRVEARDLFAANDREEMAAKEEFERSLYSQYAPAELTAEQIDEIIASVAKGTDELNFGKIMPLVMKETKGSADGHLVSERVKAYIEKVGKTT
jgi:uncharacterized protein YqeY